jgi:hypothetical protein
MPKKKLTKAQVKMNLGAMNRALRNLTIDKMDHNDSLVPMSLDKLIKVRKDTASAFKRVK